MQTTKVLFVGTRFRELEGRIEPHLGVEVQVALYPFALLKEAQHHYASNPGFFDAVVLEDTRHNIGWGQTLWAYGVKVIILSRDYSCAELDYLPPRAGNFARRLFNMLA